MGAWAHGRMGAWVYGSASSYEFPDRTLSHVKVAVSSKRERQESFLLSWVIDPHGGSGRVSLRIAPSIPLEFRFSGGRPPTLNRTWIEVMTQLSHTSRGLIIMTEEEAEAVARGDRRLAKGDATDPA